MAKKLVYSSTNHVSISMLTTITAGVHFYLSMQPTEELHNLFFINALGFAILLLAFLLPKLNAYHSKIRWLFLVYVLGTIAAWFIMGSPREGTLDPFDVVVKLVELTLAVQLVLDRKDENKK